jgi:hypothetical protein
MSDELFLKMIEKTKHIIEKEFKLNPNEICLISGGAAWSDHIVVLLYLEKYVKNAVIFSPCEWDLKKKRFNDVKKHTHDVGKIANLYHKQFSEKIKKNSLEQIHRAIEKGMIFDTTTYGFKNRNTSVSKSDYVIAFSWDENKPIRGGTADTWNKSKTKMKFYTNLENL